MKSDYIAEVKIDDLGRLCITPKKETFAYIYRAAMEVHWDKAGLFLYSPKPREWSYFDWYKQILMAAKNEYGCVLLLTTSTLWINISPALKDQFLRHVHA